MRDIKKIMAMIACVILLWGQTVRAVAIPALPYVPPGDVQIFGWLNNLYGMTAISEGTEAEKLQSYWDMYRAIMGSAFDTFRAQMQDLLDGAKTGRKMVITPALNNTINQALKNAMQNSIPIGPAKPNAVNPSEWVQRLEELGIHMTLSQAQELKNRIGNNYTGATAQPYTLGIMVGYSALHSSQGQYKLIIMPYYVGLTPTFRRHLTTQYYNFSYGENTPVSPYYVYNIDLPTMTVGAYYQNYSGGNANIPYQNYMFTLGAQQQTTSIFAMSTSASASITAEDQIPITASSEVVDGSVDRTKSIIINLPAINPYPAVNPQQIAEVLRELGVVPQSETEDVAETVTELQEEASAKYGDTGDYAVDLTTYFPFCIPFDLVRIVSALDAEPEAPHFTFPLPADIENGEVEFIEYEFSLDWMSPAMVWVRRGELVLGAIGIMLMTREIIRG